MRMFLSLLLMAARLGVGWTFCPTDQWFEYKGNCYIMTEDKIPWDSVPRVCREHHQNATFASIHSSSVNRFLSALTADASRSWTGLKRVTPTDTHQDRILSKSTPAFDGSPEADSDGRIAEDDEPSFEWADGSEVDYTDWRHDQPDSDMDLSCGLIQRRVGTRDSSTWSLGDCTDSYTAFCQIPSTNCPEGFLLHGSMCYYPLDINYDGSTQRKHCRNGVHPASVPYSSHGNGDTDAFILFHFYNIRYFWIGLHRPAEETHSPRPWRWDDGSEYDYYGWFGASDEDYYNEYKYDCAYMVRVAPPLGSCSWFPTTCNETAVKPSLLCQLPAQWV